MFSKNFCVCMGIRAAETESSGNSNRNHYRNIFEKLFNRLLLFIFTSSMEVIVLYIVLVFRGLSSTEDAEGVFANTFFKIIQTILILTEDGWMDGWSLLK